MYPEWQLGFRNQSGGEPVEAQDSCDRSRPVTTSKSLYDPEIVMHIADHWRACVLLPRDYNTLPSTRQETLIH